MALLSRLFSRLLSAGTSPEYSDYRNQIYRVSNTIFLSVIGNTTVFTAILFSYPDPTPFWVGVGALVIYSSAYALMWMKRQKLARVMLVLSGTIVVYCVAGLREESLLQVLLFSVSATAFMVFDFAEVRLATVFAIVPLLAFGIGEVTHFKVPGIHPLTGDLPIEAFRIVSVVSAVSLVASAMVHFRVQIRDHQKRIDAYLRRFHEERQMQLYAHKMASLGEMAGSMAHEINSPLTTILFRSNRLEKIAREEDISAELREKILGNIERTIDSTRKISSIIDALQTVAHSKEWKVFENANISKIVESVVSLCAQRFQSAGIEIRIAMPAELHADFDPESLGQILLNLLNNAYDATSDSQGERWVEVSASEGNGSIRIAVKNSGATIPVEIQDRLFEPFFSTKRPGRGTGLGLSISKALTESQGGRLEFLPQEKFTTFQLSLPER